MLGLGAGALVSACLPLGAFQCESDAMCVRNGTPGTCQPNDYCSYEDDVCESGQRYGDYAGGGLAGACVEDDPASTSGIAEDDGTSTVPDAPEASTGVPARESADTDDTDDTDDPAGTTGAPPPECVEPGDRCWAIVYDEPVGANQVGHGIALGPDGGWAIAASVATDPDADPADEDAWVLRYEADGTLRWAVPVVSTPGAADITRNVAIADDTTIVAVGQRAGGEAAFVMTLDDGGGETAYFEFGTGDGNTA